MIREAKRLGKIPGVAPRTDEARCRDFANSRAAQSDRHAALQHVGLAVPFARASQWRSCHMADAIAARVRLEQGSERASAPRYRDPRPPPAAARAGAAATPLAPCSCPTFVSVPCLGGTLRGRTLIGQSVPLAGAPDRAGRLPAALDTQDQPTARRRRPLRQTSPPGRFLAPQSLSPSPGQDRASRGRLACWLQLPGRAPARVRCSCSCSSRRFARRARCLARISSRWAA